MSSCIDHIVVNRAALDVVANSGLIRDLGAPGHLACPASVDVRASDGEATIWARPKPYPVDTSGPITEADDDLATQLWTPFEDRFEDAISAGNSTVAWAIFTCIAESYLDIKSYMAEFKGTHGRGQPPVFKVQPTCAPVRFPEAGPDTGPIGCFRKLFAKLVDLAKLVARVAVNGWRSVDDTQANNIARNFNKEQDKLKCLWPAFSRDAFEDVRTPQAVAEWVCKIRQSFTNYHVAKMLERIKNWVDLMRRSVNGIAGRVCSWVAKVQKTEKAPPAHHFRDTTGVTAGTRDMIDKLVNAWEPVFDCYAGCPPTWEQFEEAYNQFIPHIDE